MYGQNYVGKSIRDVFLRWAEREDLNKQSKYDKDLKKFYWLGYLNTQGNGKF